MNGTRTFSLPDLDRARSLLDQADAILIGAGAGLSAAAGLLYTDHSTFRSWFPGYREKYGLRFIYQAAFHPFPTTEEFYGYWARHIMKIRFQFPAGKPYLDLKRLVEGREHFVLTTNVDGQFEKAGFDPDRILTPQGDYAFFQCPEPCSQVIYPNREMVQAILDEMPPGAMAARTEDQPRCPNCGRLLVPNLRIDGTFVQSPWMEKYSHMERFLDAAVGKKLVLLELGVGFNTPGIIRFPFEGIAANLDATTLIRVNRDDPELGDPASREKVTTYVVDVGAFLAGLVR